MSDITPAIRFWAQDLDEAGIFELLASVESQSLPPSWPGTFLALEAGKWTLTLDPDAPFGRLCIDPASEHHHLVGRSLCDFDFIPTDRPPLDRGLALIHALSEAVDQSSQCLKDWQRYFTGKGNSGKWRVLDEPCAPEFPEPYTIYMKQEFGKPPPGGELSPIGRMMGLQVALRHHLRSANVSQHIASGGYSALNAAIMQRGLLMEPEGRMNWDFFGCVDELHLLLASGNGSVQPTGDGPAGAIPLTPINDLEPRVRDALLVLARSSTALSPLDLGRAVFGDGFRDDECRSNAKQWKRELVKLGYPITRNSYELEWEKLHPAVAVELSQLIGK